MPLVSLLFYLLAVSSCGYLLSRLFSKAQITLAEQLVLGAGTLAFATLLLGMPGFAPLRWVSLTVMVVPIVVLILCYGRSLTRRVRNAAATSWRSLAWGLLLAALLLIPLAMVLMRIPVFLPDELGHWALKVKEMMAYDDLPRGTRPMGYQFGSYPILSSLMAVNALALLGDMHEGMGRVVTFLFTSMGSLFVFEVLKRRFSTAASLLAASIVHVLVFVPSFNLYTSWYPEGHLAVLSLVAAYRLAIAFTQERPPGWAEVGVISVLLMMLVSVRPDGLVYLLASALIGVMLLAFWRTHLRERLVRFAALFPSAFIIQGVWATYASANNLPEVKTGLANPLAWWGNFGQMNPPAAVMTAVLEQLTHTDQLAPLLLALVAATTLGLATIRRLGRSDRALLLLLTIPVLRLLSLIASYLVIFSPYEAAQAAGLGRYMVQASYVTFLVLAIISLNWLSRGGILLRIRPLAYYAAAGVVMMHFAFGYLISATVSGQGNRHAAGLLSMVKEKSPQLTTFQVLCQECLGSVPALMSYYARPQILMKGQFSIGRPVSKYAALNAKREETKIHDREQYVDYLHRAGIEGVLVFQADQELERILGESLDQDKVYFFKVNDRDLEQQWWIARPPLNEVADPSLRRQLRELIGKVLNL